MKRVLRLLLAVSALATGCGGDSTTTTSPSTPEPLVSIFSGTLEPGGHVPYSLFVSATGTIDLTLFSLRPAGSATSTLSVPMVIGFGLPIDDACVYSTSTTVGAGLVKQLSVQSLAGTFCVGITDAGQLNQAADFNIKISYP